MAVGLPAYRRSVKLVTVSSKCSIELLLSQDHWSPWQL